MRSAYLLSLIYVLSSIPFFTAAAPSDKKPTPKGVAPPEETVYPKEGDFVGVRVGKYEAKKPSVAKIITTIPHPGVVVGVPSSDPEGVYKVAMISKNHPHNPPQAPITDFIANAGGIYGSVKLTSEDVPQTHLRTWKSSKTGQKQPPLDTANLKKLKEQMEPHKNWVPSKTPSPEPEENLKHKPAYQSSVKHSSSHASSSNSQVHSGSNQAGRTPGAPIKRPVVHAPHLKPSSSSGSSQKTYSQHSTSQHLHAGGTSSSGSSSSHHPQHPGHEGSRHPSFTQPRRNPKTVPNPAPHGRKSPPPAHAHQRPQHRPGQHSTVHHIGHTTWAQGTQHHAGVSSSSNKRPASPPSGSHRPKSPPSWRRPNSPARGPPNGPRPKSALSSRPPSPQRAWSSRPKVPQHSNPQHDQKKSPSSSQHATSGSRHPPKEKRFVGLRRK